MSKFSDLSDPSDFERPEEPPREVECEVCNGIGDNFDDPEFSCWYCNGSGRRPETDWERRSRMEAEAEERSNLRERDMGWI